MKLTGKTDSVDLAIVAAAFAVTLVAGVLFFVEEPGRPVPPAKDLCLPEGSTLDKTILISFPNGTKITCERYVDRVNDKTWLKCLDSAGLVPLPEVLP